MLSDASILGGDKIFSTQEDFHTQLLPQIHIYSLYPTQTKHLYDGTDYPAHLRNQICKQFRPINL